MSAPTTRCAGMPRHAHGPAATDERIYRLLLHAYPPAFRAEYGPEMMQLFRDQCQMADGGSVAFWTHLVWDVAQSAPALRAEAWRARGRESTRALGVIMKLVATLTVVLGLLATANSVAEGVMGMRQGGLSTGYRLAVVLAAVAGMLLLVAGVAALRSTDAGSSSTDAGRRSASGAALASLVVFVLARLAFGWMSIFSQLVGLALPLAILAALHWPRRRPEGV